ncbi:MAG: aminoglycoside 6-adenylyltransferase [Acidimicrobiia bacterium]|nr:aminoglycoside 6-adenylyltransferase [Acidimicrobiia bacterium]
MDTVAYAEYLERLIAALGADERVLGAVALGSTAATVRQPDQWSDHDVWVIVEPGFEEHYRTDPSWLPDHGRLVLWLRETEHGVKAVYEDGHMVEVTVFRLDELAAARVNSYRVLLDKGGVAAAMPGIRAATEEHLAGECRSEGYRVGQFITGLLVGICRFARGEKISGPEFVKVHATGHLLALIPMVLDPADPTAVDDLNPWRRVEQAFPGVASRIAAALAQDVPQATLGLLAVAEALRPHLADWPTGVAVVVRRMAGDLL